MSKRSGLLFSIVLALFVSHVSGANFAGFNTGPFYSIVGSFISPTVPTPLRVVFDGPVPTDTFIFITSSDPMVLDVAFGGVTIPAGQSSATVFVNALGLGIVRLMAQYNATRVTTEVAVVLEVPIFPNLNIEPLDGAVRLTWTTNAADYLLETNGVLANPAGWGVLTSNYSILNTNYIVTNATTDAASFYRLRKP